MIRNSPLNLLYVICVAYISNILTTTLRDHSCWPSNRLHFPSSFWDKLEGKELHWKNVVWGTTRVNSPYGTQIFQTIDLKRVICSYFVAGSHIFHPCIMDWLWSSCSGFCFLSCCFCCCCCCCCCDWRLALVIWLLLTMLLSLIISLLLLLSSELFVLKLNIATRSSKIS